MMKILFLSNMKKYSGGEIVLERLIKNLNPDEFSSIIALPEGSFAERCRKNGIDIWINNNITKLERDSGKVNYLSYLMSFTKGLNQTRKFIEIHGIDLVVANSFGISVWAYMLSFFIKKKVMWIHHHPVLDGKKIDSKAAKFFSSRFSRIICVSQAIKNSLILAGVPESKAQVIYNGLDLESFQVPPILDFPQFHSYSTPEVSSGTLDASSDNFNASSGTLDASSGNFNVSSGTLDAALAGAEKVTISLVGAIIPWKGHTYLIKAINLLEKGIQDKIKVEIVGAFLNDSPANLEYKETLTSLIASYQLGNSIQFIGHLENMADYYRENVNILLNCSQEPEPLGTTIYEAMAYSKIAIVTNVGGSTEIVENQVDGFVVNYLEPAELAACITNIVSKYTAPFLMQIRKNARLKVEEKFDIKKNAKQYEAVFIALKQKML